MFGVVVLHFLYPSCRHRHLVEVEQVGVDDFVKVYVAVVAFQNLGLRLQGTHDLLDMGKLFGGDLGGLVDEDDVAELYLLDDEVLKVFLVDVLA